MKIVKKLVGIPLWIIAIPFIIAAILTAYAADKLIDLEDLEI